MENRLYAWSGIALNGVVAPNFAVLIPCYNEADTIGELVRKVRAQGVVVFVIDDYSADDTISEAEESGARVVRNLGFKGKGGALRLGVEALGKAGFDWALAMDGDGQHDPQDIPQFFSKTADLVIGNRMAQADQMTALRRCVNRWMSHRISKMAGVEIPDTQCGMRLIRLSALSVPFTESGFAFESEIIIAFARAGLSIDSVPIRCLPARRPSRIYPVRDTFRWLRWWLRSNLRG